MAPIDTETSQRGDAAWSAGTPFGRIATAMITPFKADGSVDYDGVQRLAAHLVDAGNDALVISGTTGEAPTTSNAEKAELLRQVRAAVGGRAKIIAGVGTFDTRHSIELAQDAQKAGADGVLVVTPYYSKPTQEGLYRHFTAIADGSELPVMLYDIPPRSVVPIEESNLLRLAEHPRIVAVKDARADLALGARVIARTDLSYYCGDDALNLPWLSVGATGFVSMVSHVATPALRAMVAAHLAGDNAEALRLHRELEPLYTGISRLPGVIWLKAAMNILGLPGGPTRLPLVDADAGQTGVIKTDLAAYDGRRVG